MEEMKFLLIRKTVCAYRKKSILMKHFGIFGLSRFRCVERKQNCFSKLYTGSRKLSIETKLIELETFFLVKCDFRHQGNSLLIWLFGILIKREQSTNISSKVSEFELKYYNLLFSIQGNWKNAENWFRKAEGSFIFFSNIVYFLLNRFLTIFWLLRKSKTLTKCFLGKNNCFQLRQKLVNFEKRTAYQSKNFTLFLFEKKTNFTATKQIDCVNKFPKVIGKVGYKLHPVFVGYRTALPTHFCIMRATIAFATKSARHGQNQEKERKSFYFTECLPSQNFFSTENKYEWTKFCKKASDKQREPSKISLTKYIV